MGGADLGVVGRGVCNAFLVLNVSNTRELEEG
jgi:hypothetical protein